MWWLFLFLLFWIVCGVISAGLSNQYFRQEFEHIRNSDKNGWFNLCHSLMFGLAGPVGLIPTFFQTGFGYYGWSLQWRAEKDD